MLNTFTANKEKQYLVLVNNVQPNAATLGHNVFGLQVCAFIEGKSTCYQALEQSSQQRKLLI